MNIELKILREVFIEGAANKLRALHSNRFNYGNKNRITSQNLPLASFILKVLNGLRNFK
jgi:hypothetical protein